MMKVQLFLLIILCHNALAQDFTFSKEVYVPFEKDETIYTSNRIVPIGVKDSSYFFVQKAKKRFYIKKLNLWTNKVDLVFTDLLLKNEWPEYARFNNNGSIRIIFRNNGEDHSPRYIDVHNNVIMKKKDLQTNFQCECLGDSNEAIFADYSWYDRLRLLKRTPGKDTMVYFPIRAATYGGINNFSFFDCNAKYIVYSDANYYNLKLLSTNIETLNTVNYNKEGWIPFDKEKFLEYRKSGSTKYEAYFYMTFLNSHIEQIVFLDSNKFAVVEQRHFNGRTHYYIDLWKIVNNELHLVKENIEPPINYYYRLKNRERLNDTANYNKLSQIFSLTPKKLIVTEWVSHKKPHIAYGLRKRKSEKRREAFYTRMYQGIELDHWFGIYNHNLMQYYEAP